MAKSRYAAVFAVLAALTLFFGGMLSYKLVAGRQMVAVNAASIAASGHHEAVGIQGHVVIEVRRGGRPVATWTGHNSLTPVSRNAIAGCLSGLTSTPYFVTSCSGLTPRIGLFLDVLVSGGNCTGFCETAAAINTGVPAGCDPVNPVNGSLNLCSGWQTSGTIAITGSENGIVGAGALFAGPLPFDKITISPPLAVQTGDRVQVTITFTVS